MIRRIIYIGISLLLASCAMSPLNPQTPLTQGHALSQQGILAFQREHWHQAERLFKQALQNYKSMDALQGIAHSLINLSQVELSRQNYEAAQASLQQANSVVHRAELWTLQPKIQLLMASLALQQQQLSQAKQILLTLLPNLTPFPSKLSPIQLSAISMRTKLAFLVQQELELWLSRYEAAVNLTPDNLNHQARLLRFQAQIQQQQGHIQVAEQQLETALVHYKNNALRSGIASTLSELAQLHIQQGNWQHAHDFLTRAVNVYASLKHTKKVALISTRLQHITQQLQNSSPQ